MFKKAKVVMQMKNKLKVLVISLLMLGSISTSMAADYIFPVKSNEDYYYTPTTVNITIIKATDSVAVKKENSLRPSIQYGSYIESLNDYYTVQTKYTGKSEVLRDDGSIGTLKISEINLNLKVYDGTTSSSMKKGVGHFAETSYWDGNIALAAHNRGVNNNFGKLKKLSKGDVITYKTELGTRKYEVYFVGQIGVTDLSRLNPSNENIITLITCVEDQPLLRLCVQAKELK